MAQPGRSTCRAFAYLHWRFVPAGDVGRNLNWFFRIAFFTNICEKDSLRILAR